MTTAVTHSATDMGQCPVDHRAFSRQKTAQVPEYSPRPATQDADGVWHIYEYQQARTILRSSNTRQAGFAADLVTNEAAFIKPPILYLEGAEHHEQRRLTARYFTPTAVSNNYHQLMESCADEAIARIEKKRRVDLSDISMWLAVRVAAQVVGLTNSILPGMDRRLNSFFSTPARTPTGVQKKLSDLKRAVEVYGFFLLDVQPAIRARRKQPQEDVITHLIGQGRKDFDILVECITYASAGMVTTREFISVAAWHFLEQPELRQLYLAGDEDQRQDILQEILRLEPVVGNILRKATEDIVIEQNGAKRTIANGSSINLHIYATNGDTGVVGEEPDRICPHRPLKGDRISPAVMSFGDGHHRCPGAYVALQESDIFLQKLLRLENLRIEKQPSIRWSELLSAYEVSDFMLRLD